VADLIIGQLVGTLAHQLKCSSQSFEQLGLTEASKSVERKEEALIKVHFSQIANEIKILVAAIKTVTKIVAPCILAAIASSTFELLFASYFTMAHILPSTDPYHFGASHWMKILSFSENFLMSISVKEQFIKKPYR